MSSALKFLIVDDEPLIRMAFQRACKELSHIVKAVPDAETALEVLYDFCPDLVFVDVLLPKMQGLELVKYIKKTPAKIILISAHDELSEEKLRDIQADLFIKKPLPNIFELIKLAEKLKRSPSENN